MASVRKISSKSVNLALQGGGAQGAFTWGVLDAMLEDGRLDFEAVSGTSAGAMNAVVMSEALVDAPPGPFSETLRERARERLREFWEGVAAAGVNPFTNAPLQSLIAKWFGWDGWGLWMADIFAHMTSPYDFNPLNLNPLRDLIDNLIDFERVRSCERMQIFVCATNVETGRTRIFRRPELTADHIMASACLPYLYHAVNIDGAPHWDGGYVANPPLFPFFYESQNRDVIVVQINPIERRGTPKTAREIMDRMREITFNSSLLREYRNIDFVNRMMDENRLDPERYRKVLIHRIDGGGAMDDLTAKSRLTVSMAFFEDLFRRGRAAGQLWIDENFDQVGKLPTLDLASVLKKHDVGL